MPMEIWMTKAGIGDCIVIRCGKGEKRVNLLIDSGQGAVGFESVVHRIYWNGEKIDILILTHDDNDHVKGACNLLERIYRTQEGCVNKDIPSGRLFSELTVEQILFNFGGNGIENLGVKEVQKLSDTWKEDIDFHQLGFVLSDEEEENRAGYLNMLQLRWKIEDGILKSEILRHPKQEDLQTECEHLELVVLSPKKDTLIEYIESAWGELNKKELLKAERKEKEDEWKSSIQYWLDNPMSLGKDGSKANHASIAFLLFYEEHTMLFSGDASPYEMIAAGKRYLQKSGRSEKYLELDFIKLSHHGSSHNINSEFLKFFRTKRYLISTSGHAGYKHPGKGTLAEIAAVLEPGGRAEIYGNYNWWSQNPKFWKAESWEGNWNPERSGCRLKGKDGEFRYLDFYELRMEAVEIADKVLLSI